MQIKTRYDRALHGSHSLLGYFDVFLSEKQSHFITKYSHGTSHFSSYCLSKTADKCRLIPQPVT